MKAMKILSAAMLTAAISISPALAPAASAQNKDDAGTGDAITGAIVAKTWCANCHAVAGRRSALDAAPPFPTLAVERTLGEIRAFLARPHGMMPNIQLSRQQIDDVVAYFATLR